MLTCVIILRFNGLLDAFDDAPDEYLPFALQLTYSSVTLRAVF